MTRLWAGLAMTLMLLAAGCGILPPPEPTPEEPPVQAPEPPAPTTACAEAADPPESPVYAFFHCAGAAPNEEPRPVPRDAHAADPVSRLGAAMIGLLGGPTDAERDAGYTSFFSDHTELAVRGVAIGGDGTAIIDFDDIRPLLNNASTSAGSGALLAQLNATAFQIEEVMAVEYRIEGSCDAFWQWLQRTCTIVPRP